MEIFLKEIAGHVALAAEVICVLCVALGSAETVLRAGVGLARGRLRDQRSRRDVWVGFAGWIMLSLEFALGADIVCTAIAPTWQEIGQLAAIAVIRTGLNFFLEKDLRVFQERSPAQPADP